MRRALLISLLSLLGILLAACGPKATPTPQVVVTEVPVIVTQTVEVQKEVQVAYDPVKEAMELLPTSLHGTTDGKKYFYSKENGGIETLTGIPYEQLPCKGCHTLYNKVEGKVGQPRCESCHIDQNFAYAPVQAAVKLPNFPDDGRMQGCLSCHRRQGFEYTLMKTVTDEAGNPVMDPVTGKPYQVPAITDVHRSAPPAGKGMACVNCHTKEQMHGDGKAYKSLLESPNTQCTDCHVKEKLSQTPGHTIHGENMTCAACHAQTVVSCQGCHLNAVLAGAPEFPNQRVIGWKFLVMNNEGKYELGNLMSITFTTETGEVKSFAVIAPFYDHSIAKPKTREEKIALCASCHNNPNVKALQETGTLVISKWDEAQGKMVYPTKGVVPVPENYQQAFKLAYPYITNIDEVVQAWQEGKPQPEVEKLAKWAFGEEGPELWQMLFAKPLDKLPLQMDMQVIESFFPQQ